MRVGLVVLALFGWVGSGAAQGTRFEVTFTPEAHAGPITGRLIVAVSRQASPEPRLAFAPQGPAIFAVDLDQVRPGQPVTVDQRSLGFPTSLDSLPPGEYTVQAIIAVYTRVTRSDGHTIWVSMNDGRQEFLTQAAGNLHSTPQRARIGEGGTIAVSVTQVIPERPYPRDTEWVKRVRIQSEKLSRFWGRPIYIHATVLLPRGYAARPGTRYPAVYTFGHSIPFSFNPDSTRVQNLGRINPVTGVESGYDFYKSWVADSFPRVVAIALQQQTPYFADSYSVNSANNGPYGDALIEEVIPFLEREFRLIAEPYARLIEGASTGGWQTLALQLKHPDFFGGAWVLQPDPIDFRSYILTDIYRDTTAFTLPLGQFLTYERPFRRTVEGQPIWTMRQLSRFEEVLGTFARGGYQLGAWEAVYGPVGINGLPRPLWNKLTGTIDREVAHYMRDQGYDLRVFAEQNWASLGPKLDGKLHFSAGDMDDFYLNVAVYRFEEFLKGAPLRTPVPFVYGRPMRGHSFHDITWAELVRQMGDHVRRRAPSGADTGAWRY